MSIFPIASESFEKFREGFEFRQSILEWLLAVMVIAAIGSFSCEAARIWVTYRRRKR